MAIKLTRNLAATETPLAESVTRNSNWFTYLLARCLIRSSVRQSYFAWYAYFRTVDDVADSQTLSEDLRKDLILRQIQIVNTLYDTTDSAGITMEDPGIAFLTQLVTFDRAIGQGLLRNQILDLLSCIDFDIERIGRISPSEDLSKHIERETTSYLATLHFFCCPSTYGNAPISPYAGIAAKWTHIFRDFLPDTRQGIINIGVDEIEHYNIDIRIPHMIASGSSFRRWLMDKVRYAESYFTKGKQDLCRLRCLRYKLAVGLLCAKYERYIWNIKRDGYYLRERYEWDIWSWCYFAFKAVANVSAILYRHYYDRAEKR